MSDGHTGFSLPSLVEDSVKTNSTSSGPSTQDAKRPCGPTALYVGPGTERVAPRALFYNISQQDTEDEESEDQPVRGRRRRSASTRRRADTGSSAAVAAEGPGSTRAISRPAAVSTGSTGACGTASLTPGGMFVTSFGEAVLRGVAEQEALHAAVTFGAGPSSTGANAVAGSGLTGAGESASGGLPFAGAMVAAGLPAAGFPVSFGTNGAGDLPVEDQFTTPARPEPRCRYEHEAEVMTREYNAESQAVFRARLEYNELNVAREGQLADAMREVAVARDRTGIAEAHAQRSQTSVDQAMQRMKAEQEAHQQVLDTLGLRGQEMHAFRAEAQSLYETCVLSRTGFESESEQFVGLAAEALLQRNNEWAAELARYRVSVTASEDAESTRLTAMGTANANHWAALAQAQRIVDQKAIAQSAAELQESQNARAALTIQRAQDVRELCLVQAQWANGELAVSAQRDVSNNYNSQLLAENNESSRKIMNLNMTIAAHVAGFQ